MLAFALLRAAPGRPSDVLREREIDAGTARAFDVALGLDDPLYLQYARWLGRAVRGDFGRSYIDQRPVWDKIAERLPATLLLGSAARALGLIGLPLGLYAALTHGGLFDRMLRVGAVLASSVPHWWLGLLMLVLVAAPTGWFPLGGMFPVGDPGNIPARLRHLALPAITLALGDWVMWSRQIRAASLDVLGQDFIRTARAKGLTKRRVVSGHVLPVAILTVLPVFGASVATVVSGAVIVETVFSWPGVGRLALTAAMQRDYPVVMGLLLLSAIVVVASGLAVDVLYARSDPRIEFR